MKKLIIIVLFCVILASCSREEVEEPMDPSPTASTEASTVEKALAVSQPEAAPVKELDDSEPDEDREDRDSQLAEEKISPSGSVNLNEMTSEKESAPSGEEESVVQPAPGMPVSSAAVEAKAVEDLAERLGVQEEAVEVVAAEPIEWPDGSLGCPDEDMMYIQVITPGFLLVLKVDDQEYEFHTDLEDQMVLCIDGQPAAAP